MNYRRIILSVCVLLACLSPCFMYSQVIINDVEVEYSTSPITDFSELNFTGISTNPIGGIYVFDQDVTIDQNGRMTIASGKTGGILIKEKLTVKDFTHQATSLAGGIVNLTENSVFDISTIGDASAVFKNIKGGATLSTNIQGKSVLSTNGGVIMNQGGILSVSGATRENPIVFEGNSVVREKPWGGVLMQRAVLDAVPKSTINNVYFKNNSAVGGDTEEGFGGAIANDGGFITINNTNFDHNSATMGGAIYNKKGTVTITDSNFDGNISSYRYGGAIVNMDILNINVTENTTSYFINNKKNEDDPNSISQYGSGAINIDVASGARLNMLDPLYLEPIVIQSRAPYASAYATISKTGPGLWYLEGISVAFRYNKKTLDFSVKEGSLVLGNTPTSTDSIGGMAVSVLPGAMLGGYGAVDIVYSKGGSLAPGASSGIATAFGIFSSNEISLEDNSRLKFTLGTKGASLNVLGLGDHIYAETIDVYDKTYIDIDIKAGFGAGKYLLIESTPGGWANGFEYLELATTLTGYTLSLDILEDGFVYLIVEQIPNPYYFAFDDVVICSPATVDLTEMEPSEGNVLGLTLTYYNDEQCTELIADPESVGSGIYYIKGVDAHAGGYVASVRITQNPSPKFSFHIITVNTGGTVDFTTLKPATGSLEGLTVACFIDKNCTQLVSNPKALGVGTYYVRGINEYDCSLVVPLIIKTIVKPGDFDLTYENVNICYPETVDLTKLIPLTGTSAKYTLSYFHDDACKIQVTIPTRVGAGIYYIKAIDEKGNIAGIASVLITQNPSPQFSFHIITVNTGGTVDFTTLKPATGSLEGLTVACFIDKNCTQLVSNPKALGVGTYYVRGINEYGCSLVAPLIIKTTMVKPDDFDLTYANVDICDSETVDLTMLIPLTGNLANYTLSYFYDEACKTQVTTPTRVGAGTYYIKAVDQNGNIAGVASVKIRIDLSPRITLFGSKGGTALCNDGDLISLYVNAEGSGLIYQWYHNDRLITGANSSVYETPYTTQNEGTYYVRIEGRCATITSDTILIGRGWKPLIKWDDVLYVLNLDNKYVRYQWYRDEKPIEKYGTAVYYTDTEGLYGSYYVRVYYADGTYDDSCPIVFDKQTKGASAVIYPTLLSQNEKVTIDLAEANDYRNTRIDVYDFSGRVMCRNISNSKLTDVTANWVAGTYIVKVTLNSGKVITKNIIIK